MVKIPPKPGRYKERRIVKGILHHVITENGKIVEVLEPVKKEYPYPTEEYKPQIINSDTQSNDTSSISEEQKPTSGLQLVTYDEITPPSSGTKVEDSTKPKEDSQEKPTNEIKDTTKPKDQEKPASSIKIIPISIPKRGKVPTWEEIQSRIPEPDPDRPDPIEPKMTESENEQIQDDIIVPPHVQEIKKPNIKTPEIKIPKLQINAPKEKPIPKLEKISDKLSNVFSGTENAAYDNIYTTNTYTQSNETKHVGTNLHKADEVNRSQPFRAATSNRTPYNAPYNTKEKRRFMEQELEAELLDERRFEEWLKKQKFRENLEKAARFAEETKEQFEEKIPELSGKIEDVTGEVKNVEGRLGTVDNRLGTVDESIGKLCTGIDCVKEDVKKYQSSHDALEKLVQERFSELGEKVQSLENPMFTCEHCGEQKIRPLDSYCPNCGSPIHSWSDEDGQPIRGWTPYWKRIGKEIS